MNSLFKQYEGAFFEEAEGSKNKTKKIFGYKPFALQDAIGEKSIKNIWIEYQKLRFSGIEAEELIHNIVSKIRDMTAIMMGAAKEDLGLKDYPYNKSKRDLKNWQEIELKNLYTRLVEIYHRSRMESGNELDTALEKLLLSI